LALAQPDVPHRVVDVHGWPKVRQHLVDLGFVPGAEVEVVGENGSAIIVQLLGSRLMLRRNFAQRIHVTPLTPGLPKR
jgi:Fe2+ transport system protein FeoA